MAESKEELKKIIVDQEACIGCGSCAGVAPEYFKINEEGKSEVIKKYDDADKDKINEAADGCPVQAISIE